MIGTPDVSDAPIAVQMLYPGDWWGSDESEDQNHREHVHAEVEGKDAIAVVDSDADGLGVEVILRDYYGAAVGVVQAGHREQLGMVDALNIAADVNAGASVIVADLLPDQSDTETFCAALSRFSRATVLDHHDWTDKQMSAAKDASTFVHNPDKCATQLVCDHIHQMPSDQLIEFADVTADHDLWKKEDARSDDLSDLAWWADREQYVEITSRVGANVMEDDEAVALLSENRAVKEAKMRLAVEGPNDEELTELESSGYEVYQTGAEWHDVNEFSVALLYGDCYGSGACNRAIDAGADIAVLIREFNKVSIRSAESTPIAQDIAREFGGGGHPCAAGAKPGFIGTNGDVYFDEHWASKGEYMKSQVLNAIKRVTRD